MVRGGTWNGHCILRRVGGSSDLRTLLCLCVQVDREAIEHVKPIGILLGSARLELTFLTVASEPVFLNPDSISPSRISTFEPSMSRVGVSLAKFP
jgi:hypothetical protein